jgi:hypothetical protein
MGHQRFFQEADGLAKSFLQAGICVSGCGQRWNWQDRISHQSAVS